MAIGIFRSLEFGGINSADYDVYITGEGVYDAPERSVESVSVPGRNGAILIDNGHFENIEVKYNAGVTGSDQTEFAQKISDFRNAILSQKGYQRLTDEYNPSEYRMASYVSGLEVEATEGEQGTVGEFELVFNCKPQRFLTSGETPVTVSSGDTIDNPTLFDSSPLLEVEGHGNVSFNGCTISLDNASLGDVDAVSSYSYPSVNEAVVNLNSALYNSGDAINLNAFNLNISGKSYNGWTFQFYYATSGANVVLKNEFVSQSQTGIVSSAAWSEPVSRTQLGQFAASFTAGTSSSGTASAVYNVYNYSGSSIAGQITVTITISYNATSEALSIRASYSTNLSSQYKANWFNSTSATATVIASSTKTYLGNPTYIDCEMGEVYRKDGGVITSLNQYADLGSFLPTFSPGSNTITYDNTITSLDITPRWWKI